MTKSVMILNFPEFFFMGLYCIGHNINLFYEIIITNPILAEFISGTKGK